MPPENLKVHKALAKEAWTQTTAKLAKRNLNVQNKNKTRLLLIILIFEYTELIYIRTLSSLNICDTFNPDSIFGNTCGFGSSSHKTLFEAILISLDLLDVRHGAFNMKL